jgi:hypothetical protein
MKNNYILDKPLTNWFKCSEETDKIKREKLVLTKLDFIILTENNQDKILIKR